MSVFRDYGYRRLRTRARLKFLVADWGPEKFRNVLETEYLKRPLIDGPAIAPPPTGRRDHIGVHPQKDGNFYIGAAPTVGRISGTTLDRIADIAEQAGGDRIRLTAQQKLVILDIPPAKVDESVEALESLGLEVAPSEFRRGTMACTGIEYCKLAIVETKARAADLVMQLEDRLPTFDQPLSLHVNGCPNSCARFQTADIGFKGSLMTNEAGETVEGFQIHLGGSLGPEVGFGRKLRALKVEADDMPDYVERVTGRYTEQRTDDESFAAWVARADEGDLR